MRVKGDIEVDVTKDDQIVQEFLVRLKGKYGGRQRREGIHLTDLIYCITKKFWGEQVDFTPPDNAVLLWAIGIGLEEVLLVDDESTNRPEPKTLDGIMVSPDYILKSQGGLGELKSTRISIPKDSLEPKFGWSSGWIQQMKGYCYAYGLTEYHLAVYLVIPAEIRGFTFSFTQQELDDFWAYMIDRRKRLEQSLAQRIAPEPFAYCEAWECKRCSALTLCEVMKDTGKFIPKEG